MPDYKLPAEKHLTPEARQEIERCLDMGSISFKDIARRVGKSPTTISREVKKHLVYKDAPVVHKSGDGTPLSNKQCPELMKAPFVSMFFNIYRKSSHILVSKTRRREIRHMDNAHIVKHYGQRKARREEIQ